MRQEKRQENRKEKMNSGLAGFCFLALLGGGLLLGGCSSERTKNHAKEVAARYWQDKAYPGKAFDIQVVEAEKADGGNFRVKGIVDGETRVGTFNPDTETFSEGYYSLAHERNKRIAELEQESKYWKEKAEGLEKENYKLKVLLDMGKKSGKKKSKKGESESEDRNPSSMVIDSVDSIDSDDAPDSSNESGGPKE